MYSDKTCKECMHWHKSPTNPMQLGEGDKGVCRSSPPQIMAVPTKVRSPLLPEKTDSVLNLMMVYPETPESFPACGLFLPFESASP